MTRVAGPGLSRSWQGTLLSFLGDNRRAEMAHKDAASITEQSIELRNSPVVVDGDEQNGRSWEESMRVHASSCCMANGNWSVALIAKYNRLGLAHADEGDLLDDEEEEESTPGSSEAQMRQAVEMTELYSSYSGLATMYSRQGLATLSLG